MHIPEKRWVDCIAYVLLALVVGGIFMLVIFWNSGWFKPLRFYTLAFVYMVGLPVVGGFVLHMLDRGGRINGGR